MAKVEITGIKQLQQTLKKKTATIKPQTLTVGFLENAMYPDNKTRVIDVAAYNEYGDPARNRPPRPFMQQTKQTYSSQWSAQLEKLVKANNGDYKKAMELLGNIIKGQIQKTIAQGTFAPNAPSTIAQKGKNTPLKDTMVMFNSVDYEVE